MESKLRTIVKTILFKIGTTTITVAMYLDIKSALSLHLVLTLFYIVYERVWVHIKWERKSSQASKP